MVNDQTPAGMHSTGIAATSLSNTIIPKITAPHDKGYKRDLSIPKEFLHFLKKYVGADWTKNLYESQLRLCDKEFIDKDYDGKNADIIYEIAKPSGEKVYAFVLQELQSTVDYTMIFRILIYIVNNLLRFSITCYDSYCIL